jgi:hypothetical protein
MNLIGHEIDGDCRYILDEGTSCGAARRGASAYCAAHHALCHIPRGSRKEAIALRQIERVSAVVGIGLNSRVLISADVHSLSRIL